MFRSLIAALLGLGLATALGACTKEEAPKVAAVAMPLAPPLAAAPGPLDTRLVGVWKEQNKAHHAETVATLNADGTFTFTAVFALSNDVSDCVVTRRAAGAFTTTANQVTLDIKSHGQRTEKCKDAAANKANEPWPKEFLDQFRQQHPAGYEVNERTLTIRHKDGQQHVLTRGSRS